MIGYPVSFTMYPSGLYQLMLIYHLFSDSPIQKRSETDHKGDRTSDVITSKKQGTDGR